MRFDKITLHNIFGTLIKKLKKKKIYILATKEKKIDN